MKIPPSLSSSVGATTKFFYLLFLSKLYSCCTRFFDSVIIYFFVRQLFLLLLESTTDFNFSFQPIFTENWFVLVWFRLRTQRNACKLTFSMVANTSTVIRVGKCCLNSYHKQSDTCWCFLQIAIQRFCASRLDCSRLHQIFWVGKFLANFWIFTP